MNWLSRVEKMSNEEAIENVLVTVKLDSVLFGRKGAKSLKTSAIMMLLQATLNAAVAREKQDKAGFSVMTAGDLDELAMPKGIMRIKLSRDSNESRRTGDMSDGSEQIFSGLYAAEPLLRVNAIKQGLPALLPSIFAQRMGISKERMYGTIGLPRATVERKVKDDEVLTPDESSRVLGIARLIGQAQSMVGDQANFDAPTWVANWLDSYLPALQCKPAELMDTTEGQALISNLLARAESGAYS